MREERASIVDPRYEPSPGNLSSKLVWTVEQAIRRLNDRLSEQKLWGTGFLTVERPMKRGWTGGCNGPDA